MASPKTVLIVDDQAFIRQMMGKPLVATGRYRLLEAADGKAAIELMRNATTKHNNVAGTDLLQNRSAGDLQIDCIVSDINMLPMNGLEFVKAIRTGLTPVDRGIPVLMLTGHTEKHLLATSIQLDVNGFLVKPVSAKVFIERIEHALDAPTSLKPVADYATLVVPELDAEDLWSSSAAMRGSAPAMRAADLVDSQARRVPPSELRVGDRLAEDLRTEDGVLVVPSGSRVAPALIAAIHDLAQVVTLQARVAVLAG
jgi:CheY-like chemotaxis protein